jgi:serine/threonine-protein kinase
MADDWIGRRLKGRYEILERLGAGGMSSVFKARDANLDRVVAIKIIHPHLSETEDFVRRFRDEATVVGGLRHPNIVQVFDFDEDDDTYFIVFEFIAGETLQERLGRLSEAGQRMTTEEVATIGAELCDALAYAHERGLVHRDVKPANVMLDVHGDALLTDFGIVKITGATQHTATGAVVGTARYMSPEQIRGTQLDGRTDLYSLGVVLFEMASGAPPYAADSAMTLMMMHVSDPVPDMDAAGIPAPLGEVIGRALAKDPDERPATATELAEQLRAVIASAQTESAEPVEPVVTAEPTAPGPSPEPGAPPAATIIPPSGPSSGTGSRRTVVVGAAVVATLVMVALVVVLPGLGDDSTVEAVASDSESASEPTNDPTDARDEATDNGPASPSPIPTDAVTAATTNPALPETVEIRDIALDDGTYVVTYDTAGYTERLPGLHVHFYWNSIPEVRAGVGPNQADWFVWGGPRPFDGWTTTDRPSDATGMCAVVANEDHTIKPGTGNCMALP